MDLEGERDWWVGVGCVVAGVGWGGGQGSRHLLCGDGIADLRQHQGSMILTFLSENMPSMEAAVRCGG